MRSNINLRVNARKPFPHMAHMYLKHETNCSKFVGKRALRNTIF